MTKHELEQIKAGHIVHTCCPELRHGGTGMIPQHTSVPSTGAEVVSQHFHAEVFDSHHAVSVNIMYSLCPGLKRMNFFSSIAGF